MSDQEIREDVVARAVEQVKRRSQCSWHPHGHFWNIHGSGGEAYKHCGYCGVTYSDEDYLIKLGEKNS